MAQLPSIDDLKSRAKRQKTEIASLKAAFSTVSSLNISEEKVCKLSQEEREFWLVAKFGLTQVSKLCRVMKSIPSTLTKKQREDFATRLYGEECKSLLVSILECCPHLIVQQETEDDHCILAPPTGSCYDCQHGLVSNHETKVTCYTMKGCTDGVKCTLRCKRCNVTYNYAQFGRKSDVGFRYYPEQRRFVEVTDTVYFSRELLELQCSLANHSWVSFQGFSESYNDAFELAVGKQLSPRTVAEAFYNGETENELRRMDKVDFRFKKDSDREECMMMIETVRRERLYPHNAQMCTEDCKQRGCGHLWVTDGIWKTVFPHCMFRVEQSVQGIPALNLPDVCTASPERNKAFCSEHCQLLNRDAPNVPTGLKDFLKFCGASEDDVSSNDVQRVDSVVEGITVDSNSVGESAHTSQGTSTLVSSHPELLDGSFDDSVPREVCRKDTGQGKKLRKWSRGHQFIVRGGGHIDSWQPLYRSESPSQVFLIVIQWLLSLERDGGGGKREIALAYDNMCNLAKLKIAREPLPFPPPLDRVWLDIHKFIDTFHLRNHVSTECHRTYSPAEFKEKHPNFNTQAGEQTFVWVSRFRHILCSMNKVHHLFYLHRMVVRRNAYTSKCYAYGKKPILPKVTKSDR